MGGEENKQQRANMQDENNTNKTANPYKKGEMVVLTEHQRKTH
jgi:hypothetical protein